MSGNWIAVASADHVWRGRAAGFMQICHGKAAPLRRIKPGDHVVYYSPTLEFRGKEALQAFTAIGRVGEGEPYEFDMGGGFHPFRRDVAWLTAREAPIQPLLDKLNFTAGVRNWGSRLRFGLLPVSGHDLELIATAMAAHLPV
jgi:EVE domain